jgi:hypothetical protein
VIQGGDINNKRLIAKDSADPSTAVAGIRDLPAGEAMI